jgi:esterase/lipase superfamily enzyme
MKREYTKWFSPILNREMELLVFGHEGIPVLFFPTRTARFYDYENWRIIDALKHKIENGEMQVFCVDSYDIESFYSHRHPEEKINRHVDYERYLLHEVIPFIQKRNNNSIISAGCSLGGYHALNIALRHPTHFCKVIGMSARYDLTISSNRFNDLLNGYFNDTIYYNMPSMFMPNLYDKNILDEIKKLDITIVIGNEDPFLKNNEHFACTLFDKELNTNFIVWNEEAHRAFYWRRMVQLYL